MPKSSGRRGGAKGGQRGGSKGGNQKSGGGGGWPAKTGNLSGKGRINAPSKGK